MEYIPSPKPDHHGNKSPNKSLGITGLRKCLQSPYLPPTLVTCKHELGAYFWIIHRCLLLVAGFFVLLAICCVQHCCVAVCSVLSMVPEFCVLHFVCCWPLSDCFLLLTALYLVPADSAVPFGPLFSLCLAACWFWMFMGLVYVFIRHLTFAVSCWLNADGVLTVCFVGIREAHLYIQQSHFKSWTSAIVYFFCMDAERGCFYAVFGSLTLIFCRRWSPWTSGRHGT